MIKGSVARMALTPWSLSALSIWFSCSSVQEMDAVFTPSLCRTESVASVSML